MNIVIDMNLSPQWVRVLEQEGWTAVHWSTIGAITAPDAEIMAWARMHEHVVFTHDLDFGVLLALTHANGPSVIQMRTDDVLPQQIGDTVVSVLHRHQTELISGALITIDERRARVRLLPIG